MRRVIRGNVVLPTDANYLHARRVWNGAVGHYPALFVQCMTGDSTGAAFERLYSASLDERSFMHNPQPVVWPTPEVSVSPNAHVGSIARTELINAQPRHVVTQTHKTWKCLD
jgi:hypothetical protein